MNDVLAKWKPYIAQTADPEQVSLKLEVLLDDQIAMAIINQFDSEKCMRLVKVLDASNFLFRFMQRHPEDIICLTQTYSFNQPENIQEPQALRLYKYRCLLQITWMDLTDHVEYKQILSALSHLADTILNIANNLVHREHKTIAIDNNKDFVVIALGKLGGHELNYSSDVDIIFVLRDEDSKENYLLYEHYSKHARRFCRLLEQNTEEGFLYRTDLNLRPWGRSAPIMLSLQETEQYYESNHEAWERIAWLRARYVCGSDGLAKSLLDSIKTVMFHGALSIENIKEFTKIKEMMRAEREKQGSWNVKTGKGGIRDIEFFVHVLQTAHITKHTDLQQSHSILEALNLICEYGLIRADERDQLYKSYVFLRRLEHRLQMIDEQQTHVLLQTTSDMQNIAIRMGYLGDSKEQIYNDFYEDLIFHQNIATNFFNRLLQEGITTDE